ncbi:unnamed protein product [Brachionus calyciflorus]|uniref:Pre-rRNA-processing protein Ipi1 N-terminal domain-containing protein n=1 Tax=Brachionus calyciflorus TaxID=104777 RepID=A0A814FGZ1_9BILA|nr:unnamed protein product [Brachionus calyciflorus]
MGKNKQPNAISAKKAKQLDFQKVKFKVGKKLPKNLNETRATFKAKTLILKQQFQEKKGPVSHRNLSWKELLAHLGHLNQSVKLDALNSLKEMILQNDDLIRLEFANLLENLCPLFSDREYKVRENSIGLFKTLILLPIFKENSNQLLKPFFNLITVYLSCAMTHISDNIQYSSLKLLDILIEHIPELVKKSAYSIFDNFIEQISKASVKNDSKRVLKNDPYKLTSTQTWRHNVLNRLQKILLIISKDYKEIDLSKHQVNILKTNNWILNTYRHDSERLALPISKKLTNKKDITDLDEFYEHYLKIVAPLLIECWIESKPENKNSIDNSESLGIMHLVLNIFNIMIDNLDLSIKDLNKFIKVPKSMNVESFFEGLFLADFPYILAENYDPESEHNKKLLCDGSHQVSSTSLNLLICKFCSSSLLTMNEEKCLEILTYCLNSLDSSNSENNKISNNNELQIILKLSKRIFSDFKDPKIIKPFLTSLINFLDSNSKSLNTKWNVYEFLSKQFFENNNLIQFDASYQLFCKKLIKFFIQNIKEKKYERNAEALIDWIRNLSIRKTNSKKSIQNLLEQEFINILNLCDFKELNETNSKKLIELINCLPRINSYLITKLAFLVLSNTLSLFNLNQLLSILKEKLEMEHCEPNDYFMFLLHLINGYSSFELIHGNSDYQTGEFYLFENKAKFNSHVNLCNELESFISSHKQSDSILNLLLASSVPQLNKIEKGVYTSTLYGSLCLISQIDDMNSIGANYENIVLVWLGNSFYWIASKFFEYKTENLNVDNEEMVQCVEILFRKFLQILNKSERVLNDCTSAIVNMLNLSNEVQNVRTVFLIVNFLIKNYSSKLKQSNNLFNNILGVYQSLNGSEYVWWHEFVHLIKTL